MNLDGFAKTVGNRAGSVEAQLRREVAELRARVASDNKQLSYYVEQNAALHDELETQKQLTEHFRESAMENLRALTDRARALTDRGVQAIDVEMPGYTHSQALTDLGPPLLKDSLWIMNGPLIP